MSDGLGLIAMGALWGGLWLGLRRGQLWIRYRPVARGERLMVLWLVGGAAVAFLAAGVVNLILRST